MNLIKVSIACRPCHELPDALIQSAFEQQIRTGALDAPLIVERRPFPKDSWRIEIDVMVGRGRFALCHFPFAFSPSSISGRTASEPPGRSCFRRLLLFRLRNSLAVIRKAVSITWVGSRLA